METTTQRTGSAVPPAASAAATAAAPATGAAAGTMATPAAGERRAAGDPTPPCPPGTLTRMFFDTVGRTPDKPALMHKEQGAYRSISYRELAERVRALAQSLM